MFGADGADGADDYIRVFAYRVGAVREGSSENIRSICPAAPCHLSFVLLVHVVSLLFSAVITQRPSRRGAGWRDPGILKPHLLLSNVFV